MSADRKLLELAAKAAGLKEFTVLNGRPAIRARWTGLQDWDPWNPLDNDGDAFRLAVKLGMSVHTGKGAGAHAFWYDDDDDGCATSASESPARDPAAMRRAIVRCAAEIGRAMK